MGKNIAVIVGLLFVGLIGAVVAWLVVYLPFRVMQPLEFTPAQPTEETALRLQEKAQGFAEGTKTEIDLDGNDLSLLLQNGMQEHLGIDISALTVIIGENTVTAIVEVQVSDIPSSGYLTWLLTRRNAERTTTLIGARVWADRGMIAYELLDFRIGRFKIPMFIIRRLIREERRSLEGLYIREIEFHEGHLRLVQ
jgi:hypothetical protein